jgi:hypothetical protein
MREQGVSIEEVARRIRRSPAHVARIVEWTQIPRSGSPVKRTPRAIEARVLALRASGESYEQIGQRFHRGARFVRQVEGLAYFKRAMELLTAPSR